MDILLALALLPSIVLGAFIYKKDKAEKEPKALLAILFICGVAICYPAAYMEQFLFASIDLLLPSQSVIRTAAENFIGVALVEELFKWLPMILITRKSKHFNSVFDGIVYAVFVSLGFATFENILYVLDGGIEVALARAVLAVPGHVFDAIFMGYYYSWYHLKVVAGKYETELVSLGGITCNKEKFSGKRDLVLSLLIPIITHGFYDFCLSVDSDLMFLVFLGFVIFMYIYCFRQVFKLSKGDMADTKMALVMVCAKYPEVFETVNKLQLVRTRRAEEAGEVSVAPVDFEDLCDYLRYGDAEPAYAEVGAVQPVATVVAPCVPKLGKIRDPKKNRNDISVIKN